MFVWSRILATAALLSLTAVAQVQAQTVASPPDNPAAPAAPSEEQQSARLEFFEKKVRPLLIANCYNCHSANTNARGGLRVDDRQGLLVGGGRGAAVVPHQPDESLLLKSVLQEDDKLKMPPGKKLADEDIAVLREWIAQGATWPELRVSATITEAPAEYESLRNEHWAWQPLKSATVPVVRDVAWPRDDIDWFLLAKLEDKQLAPVGDADKVALIRRVSFDLTGLPPTPGEIEAFVADSSADSFTKVVDRLLASPAYGEQWGRHWLDVARYGESSGSSRNLPLPHAWRYRDYVVQAFQNDKPYNEFIQEQVAGDLLPANSPAERDEHLIATGFLAIGVKDVNQRFKVRYLMDNVDEQIDVLSRSVLGLTASCARCHDHKFDPIPTADYYGLAGILRSTDTCDGLRNKMGGGGLDYYDSQALHKLSSPAGATEVNAAKVEELKAQIEEARKAFVALRDSPEGDEKAPNGRPKKQVARNKMNRLQQELNLLNDPAAQGPVAYGLRDSRQVADTEIRIRGEAEKLGPVVPRSFLSVVQFPGQPTINPQQSGRLELAQWLTHQQNPLTQRVVVNRVWLHLFGKGLVQSADNFGTTGDTPSHPELLDHLAQRFVAEGWSIKRLVRTLVLTRAYQLSSEVSPAHLAQDPANRLVWRHTPRRLSGEELRDATLAISGSLNTAPGEGSVIQKISVVELRNNGPEARKIVDQGRADTHRSLYLPLLRGLVPTALEVFDFADQGLVTGSRDTTTVPQQALYLLNDPFVRKQAAALAEQTLQLPDMNETAKLQRLYGLILGRAASSAELERAQAYLADYEATTSSLIAEAAAVKAAAELQVAVADTPAEGTNGTTPPIIDPDQADQSDAPVVEEEIQIANPKTAAWTSLCQALLGSAEFRFLK